MHGLGAIGHAMDGNGYLGHHFHPYMLGWYREKMFQNPYLYHHLWKHSSHLVGYDCVATELGQDHGVGHLVGELPNVIHIKQHHHPMNNHLVSTKHKDRLCFEEEVWYQDSTNHM